MKSTKSAWIASIAIALSLATARSASAITIIDATTLNGSFESETGGTWASVTAWENWSAALGGTSTASNDSGTYVPGGRTAGVDAATQGTRVAYLQPGNAAYNLTGYTIQAGDQFTYTWDWILPGRANATVGLAYQAANGSIIAIPGTTTTSPNTTAQNRNIGTAYTVPAGSAWIGRPVAMTITSGGNYPEVDNFVLNVVPEPGVAGLAGSAGLLLLTRRRNRRRTLAAR